MAEPAGQQTQENALASNAVEMNNLQSQAQSVDDVAESSTSPKDNTATSSVPEAQTSEPANTSSNPDQKPTTESAAKPQSAPDNTEDMEAIGPSTTTKSKKEDSPAGPVVNITLLLTSGSRHPYKIDQKYLKKRSVDVENQDPFNISVYTLKELIWRDWRDDWDPRPSNPSYIRLIHFGRMLEDKLPLKECRFNHDAPNIVHMTVKPQEIIDEEDTKTGKGGRDRDGEDRDAGCRCVIL